MLFRSAFTASWLTLLRETQEKILEDLRALRASERKQAEAQSESAAIRRMYTMQGELRRFLHGSDPVAPAPFLRSPIPDGMKFVCGDADPQVVAGSVCRVDTRVRATCERDTVTVENIPPSALRRVLLAAGVIPGVTLTSSGGMVGAAEDRLGCWEFKLATDGLATRSRCGRCQQHTILPIPYVDGASRRVDCFCTQ